jgi:hypothetical protein
MPAASSEAGYARSLDRTVKQFTLIRSQRKGVNPAVRQPQGRLRNAREPESSESRGQLGASICCVSRPWPLDGQPDWGAFTGQVCV